MNKKYIALFIISIIVMNLFWYNALSEEKNDTAELKLKIIDLDEKVATLSNNLGIRTREYELLTNEYDDKLSEWEKEIAAYETEVNGQTKLAREYHIKVPKFEDYEEMSLYKIKEGIYSMPYSDSEKIFNDESIGFVLAVFMNELNEEWVYVESLYSENESERYGFIQLENLGGELIPEETKEYMGINFNGIRIGNSIYDVLRPFSHNITLEIKDDYYKLIIDKVSVLISPETWTVHGLLTRDEDVTILKDIHVGRKAKEVIVELKGLYPFLISNEEDVGEYHNWFDLEFDGLALSVEYAGSYIEQSPEVIVAEITLIKLN